MDKYEYQVCADQIKNLIAERKYAEAAEIADTINWRRVKSVSMLCTVSEIYKINKRYEESRDILLLAYDRYPNGRMIVYALCELAIKMNDVVQAIEYYKEFVRVAPGDTGSYILLYKIYEAQDVSIEERIKVLEEFKKRDYRERWAYELALLYHKTGQEALCIDACDELILWFGEGKYVKKAMELKMQHANLTSDQQTKYNGSYYGSDQAPAMGEQPGKSSENTGSSENADRFSTQNLQNELEQSMEKYLGQDSQTGEQALFQEEQLQSGSSEEAQLPENDTEHPGMVVQQMEGASPAKTQEFVLDPENSFVQQFYNSLQSVVQENTSGSVIKPAEAPADHIPQAGPDMGIPEKTEINVPGEEAENEAEDNIENDGSEAEEAAAQTAEKEAEDTETASRLTENNLARPAGASRDKMNEISRRYDNMLRQDYDGQFHFSLPDTDMVERQITGQLNLEEVLKNYEERQRRLGNTDDFFAQLSTVIPQAAESNSSVKTLEESKPRLQQVHASQTTVSLMEEEEEEKTETGAEVTGEETSGTETPEMPQEEAKEAETAVQEETGVSEETDAEEETGEKQEEAEEETEEKEETGESAEEAEETDEAVSEEEADEEKTDEEEQEDEPPRFYELDDYGEVEEIEDIEQPDEVDDIIKTSNLPIEEIAEYNALVEMAMNPEPKEPEPLPSNYDEFGRMKHPSYMVLEESRTARRNFEKNEYKLFGRYDGIEDIKAQLVDVLDDMSMDAGHGNVVLMGDEVSCRKTLSIDIVKAMQSMDSTFKGKVAKISGEALNKKNIPATLRKLDNGALIIEEAGGLSAAALTIIAQSLLNDVESVLIVLEGSRESLLPLLESDPRLFGAVFDTRVDISPFTNDDLVAYAKGYAKEQEHSIDEMGTLALYTRIGELQTLDHQVTVEDIKDLIDTAIAHVDKMTFSHLMDVLVAKRYDDDDFIIIREKDFLLNGKKQQKLKKKQKKSKSNGGK
ncbi:MAG: hypothetical protein K6G83_16165 [Lachnospiraceae bacterium]|nr:hypothetical protein [Lachnospiraceae bacterium]